MKGWYFSMLKDVRAQTSERPKKARHGKHRAWQGGRRTLSIFSSLLEKANHTRLRFAGKAWFSRLLVARAAALAAAGQSQLKLELL